MRLLASSELSQHLLHLSTNKEIYNDLQMTKRALLKPHVLAVGGASEALGYSASLFLFCCFFCVDSFLSLNILHFRAGSELLVARMPVDYIIVMLLILYLVEIICLFNVVYHETSSVAVFLIIMAAIVSVISSK